MVNGQYYLTIRDMLELVDGMNLDDKIVFRIEDECSCGYKNLNISDAKAYPSFINSRDGVVIITLNLLSTFCPCTQIKECLEKIGHDNSFKL